MMSIAKQYQSTFMRFQTWVLKVIAAINPIQVTINVRTDVLGNIRESVKSFDIQRDSLDH